jgi:hypothetical protein
VHHAGKKKGVARERGGWMSLISPNEGLLLWEVVEENSMGNGETTKFSCIQLILDCSPLTRRAKQIFVADVFEIW